MLNITRGRLLEKERDRKNILNITRRRMREREEVQESVVEMDRWVIV